MSAVLGSAAAVTDWLETHCHCWAEEGDSRWRLNEEQCLRSCKAAMNQTSNLREGGIPLRARVPFMFLIIGMLINEIGLSCLEVGHFVRKRTISDFSRDVEFIWCVMNCL